MGIIHQDHNIVSCDTNTLQNLLINFVQTYFLCYTKPVYTSKLKPFTFLFHILNVLPEEQLMDK